MNDPGTTSVTNKAAIDDDVSLFNSGILEWWFISFANQICALQSRKDCVFAFHNFLNQIGSDNEDFIILLNTRILKGSVNS
ncbi:hypothetical protein D3C73_685270 [compost metagenome]